MGAEPAVAENRIGQQTNSKITKGTSEQMGLIITLLVIFLIFAVAGWGWRKGRGG
ncbi:MAG: hypothetical protein QOI56_466 [Actinomycetota bacterium]|jgi:hypothetical protein|nr:hypothetical protein [Actinomycetota bacterium]